MPRPFGLYIALMVWLTSAWQKFTGLELIEYGGFNTIHLSKIVK